VVPLFSLDLEGNRSLFQRLADAASPAHTFFEHAATMPTDFSNVFRLAMALLPT
jgi:hypothetical protein